MNKIWMVVRREYRESVRKKSFWIGTLAFPLAIALLLLISVAAQVVNPATQKRIAVVDRHGGLFEPLQSGLAEHLLGADEAEYVLESVPPAADAAEQQRALEARVLRDELYGILSASADLDSEDAFRLYRKNVGDEDTFDELRQALHDAVVGQRLESSHLELERQQLDALVAPVALGGYQITAGGESKRKGFGEAFIGPYLFVMVLYFTLYFYGYATLRGILQEKSNRVMEVLLGSLSPDQLMTGKIIGIGLVGLTQVGIYALAAGVARLVALTFVGGGDLEALLDAVSPGILLFFVLFFILGYVMFTSMFAMVGAVCNTEQDAQSLQAPLILLLMLPMLLSFFFVKHPDSTAAAVVSLIPFFTPMVMYMRISTLTPPAWQIALSIALMLGTTYLLFRGAAKVFRVGTLMYGKKPTVREIWRWARG